MFEAGLKREQSTYNEELSRAVFRKWLATDSYSYLSLIEKLASLSFRIKVNEMNAIDQKRLLMLYYDLFENAGRFQSLQEMVDSLSRDIVFCEELKEVMPLLLKDNKAYEKADN